MEKFREICLIQLNQWKGKNMYGKIEKYVKRGE